MKKVILAGGSGMIGRELCALLVRLDYEVVILSRSNNAPAGARAVVWDAQSPGDWVDELEGATAIVNLVGEPISVKWTKESKLEILQSRLRSAQVIAAAIGKCAEPPKVWVNASAVGFYGNRGATELTEESGAGPRRDFIVDTCFAWENVVANATVPSTRKVIARFGIVLGRDGGMLPPMLKLAKWFLGGQVGPGTQYISWVHVKDLVRLVVFAIERETPPIINVTSPTPSTNRFFMGVLRAMVGRPWAPPVPAFGLKIANWFGAPDPSLLLNGQRVLPAAALEAGFTFEFDDLRDAVRNLTGEAL
jgi:uncharacterized protein (TIGR01777 family)